MDLQMPELNGLEATIAIRGESPTRASSSSRPTPATSRCSARAGRRPRVSVEDAADKELLTTIRAVHSGKKALSSEASFELAEHATDEALTPAEIEVLRLIAAGNANKQIAAQLSITEDTVKGRVKNILSKLGAKAIATHAAIIGSGADHREPRTGYRR